MALSKWKFQIFNPVHKKILDVSEKTRALVDHSAKYLANYLEKGQISEEELWNYINPEGVRNQLELVKKADKG